MYAWILGVFVLSCCLILLPPTYLRTDGIHLLFCCCGQVGLEEEEEEGKKRKERWRRTLHLPGGLLLGYVGTPYLLLLFYFRGGRVCGDSPQLQLQSKGKKQSELTKPPFFSFPIPEISRSRTRPRQSTPKPCSSQRIPSRTRNQILDVRTSRCGSFGGNSSCGETSRE